MEQACYLLRNYQLTAARAHLVSRLMVLYMRDRVVQRIRHPVDRRDLPPGFGRRSLASQALWFMEVEAEETPRYVIRLMSVVIRARHASTGF